MKCFLKKSKAILLIFVIFSFLISNLPVYSAPPSCSGGFTSASCPKLTQNVSCPFETFNRCTPQGPRCCRISIMINPDYSINFEDQYDCSAGIVPECVCDTSRLINACSGIGIPDFNTCDCDISTYSCSVGIKCPSNPLLPGLCCPNGCCPSDSTKCKCSNSNSCEPFCPAPPTIATYTCNPGYISCPDIFTKEGSCCPISVGCCPSNPNQCKCSNSNQCSPNCTVQPPPPETYKCDSGTICPNNTTPSAICCQYGCCPSDSTKCKCSNNSQCSPNCTVSTPTTQPPSTQPPFSPSTNSNSTLSISSIDSIFASAGLKRYNITLTITSSNFASASLCTASPTIAGLGIRIKPTGFYLGPGTTSKPIQITIPITRTLKGLNSLPFKVNCGNGASATKAILIK